MKLFKTPRAAGSVLASLALIFSLCFSSCKEEPLDITDLLSTVPSSAGAVAGINVKSLLDKAGCKVEGSQVTAGAELQKLLEANGSSQSPLFSVLLNGDSGIDPLGAVVFIDGNRGYITCLLADVNKFRSFVEKQNESTFETKDKGVDVCGNVAVKGPQTWICFTSSTIQDPAAIAAYTSMDVSQSFIQNGFAEEIALMKDDLIGWSTIRTLLGQTVSFSEIAGINLVSSVLFQDPQSISFRATFDKGKFTMSANILNDKGKPAKYLLPAEKINVSTVEKVGEQADFLIAMTITPKLIDALSKLGRSIASSYFDHFKEALEHVDGTVAVAFSNPEALEQNISGVITTDGQTPRSLLDFVSSFAPYKKDGKYVLFSRGEMNGTLNVKEGAELLKGSTIGVVGSLETFKFEPLPSLKSVCVNFTPEDGSLKCVVAVTNNNPKENILLSIIKDNPSNLL